MSASVGIVRSSIAGCVREVLPAPAAIDGPPMRETYGTTSRVAG